MSGGFWYKAPLRKPLTAIVVLFTLSLIARYAYIGADIPQNMMYLLAAMNGVSVGGYMGSSAYESRYGDGWNGAEQMQQPSAYTEYDSKEETH